MFYTFAMLQQNRPKEKNMNYDKLNYNLKKLDKMFPNNSSLNKSQMLIAINKSYSTSKRRDDLNIKTDIPQATKVIPFARKGNPTNGYQYDMYDIAVFITDRDYYWEMIEKKKEKNNA